MSSIISAILFTLLLCGNAKKRDYLKASVELIEKERTRLKEAGISCSHNTVSQKIIDNLRLSDQSGQAIACHLKLLESADGNQQLQSWTWSSLGQVYLNQASVKVNGLANTCFKQALKLGHKVDSFVKQWYFLGPFVIGKSEVDGDPVESLGGIHNVSRTRFKKKVKYYSELVPNGELTWQVYAQSRGPEYVQIQPQVNWNDLVNSLGSTATTEWQGWVIGEFAVNDNNINVILQCMGVHTVFIDRTPVAADVYRREHFWFSVQLSKGIHTISIRLRAKGVQVFQCQLKVAPSVFEILKPPYLPDLYHGYLFSGHLYLPISNHHVSKWLQVIKVSLHEHSSEASLSISRVDSKQLSIAPGQTRPIVLQLSADDPRLFEGCADLHLKLKLLTSEEQLVYPLSLRCRHQAESFIFTFLDHDGSVQHAAAMEPLEKMDLAPVLLTLHGTTVPAQNQADSYKHMVDGKFVFGLERAWVLAPTRHGAHNWEGPGALTAMTALHSLASLAEQHSWLSTRAASDYVIFAGHSMGGHGAWHLATHHPDRALAVVSLAGWIKKEEYGDSNLFFRHDIGTSYVDPAVKGVLEACIAENDADRHVSNLWGVPVMTRIGAKDRTIHPYFTRRMYRLLQEWHINVTYVEIPGLEHWWWDTKDTNDGGCVNDQQLRDFTNDLAVIPGSGHCEHGGAEAGCTGEGQAGGRYSEGSQQTQTFTYHVINPAYGESMRGLRVLQQLVSFRTSTVQGVVTPDTVRLTTSNVQRLSVRPALLRPIDWTHRALQIDQQVFAAEQIHSVLSNKDHCLCKSKDGWTVCQDCNTYQETGRGPTNLGPARRVAEGPFLIVVGTQAAESENRVILDSAVYIANLFYLTADTMATVVKDRDLTVEMAANYNLIVLGKPSENSFSGRFLEKVPLDITEDDAIQLHSCHFDDPRTGALFVAPHSEGKLALVLLGSTIQGLQDVVSLATPTIPPMTRSPFSNMIPDVVVTGPDYSRHGAGGYLCAGFWDNKWQFRPELASCAHCV